MSNPHQSDLMKRCWADPEWRRQQIVAIERGKDNAADAATMALLHLTEEEKRHYKILRAQSGVSRTDALTKLGKLATT